MTRRGRERGPRLLPISQSFELSLWVVPYAVSVQINNCSPTPSQKHTHTLWTQRLYEREEELYNRWFFQDTLLPQTASLCDMRDKMMPSYQLWVARKIADFDCHICCSISKNTVSPVNCLGCFFAFGPTVWEWELLQRNLQNTIHLPAQQRPCLNLLGWFSSLDVPVLCAGSQSRSPSDWDHRC